MKKFAISSCLCLFTVLGYAQTTEYMVIEKKDNSKLKLEVDDIKRVFFESEYNLFGSPAEIVDLGLSVNWASWNMGAKSPEGVGSYFYWGDASGVAHCASNQYTSISGTEYDVAHIQWGENWRLPTMDELAELVDNCSFTWTTLNGVEGGLFTSKKPGYTNKSIFIPAGGDEFNGEFRYQNEFGKCWCGDLFTNDGNQYAYSIDFDRNGANSNYGWGLGVKQPVRPVYDKKGEHPSLAVYTGEAKDITKTSVILEGQVSASNLTHFSYGFFLSKSGTPSNENHIKDDEGYELNYQGNFKTYTLTFIGLEPRTWYYYCMFVFDGNSYYYGETKSFTTKE